ncbi:MAG TPA: hydrogenase maturation protease [Desulfocapsa sulfexigens]|nr:hydrogenase maturation protease [Desulfocapsa sulfexigens]
MKTKKTGILGIGNLLMGDDGFGVQCVEQFIRNYTLPENLTVLDGGTAGIMLAPFIEEVDIIYILDAVDLQDEPGSIHRFSNDDVQSGDIQTRMSPHQVGLLEILELCKLRGKAPERVEMITVVPENLSLGIGLSPRVQPKVNEVLDILFDCLVSDGLVLQKKGNIRECTNSLLLRA